MQFLFCFIFNQLNFPFILGEPDSVLLSVPGLWALSWISSRNPVPGGHSPAGGFTIYTDPAKKKHQ